MPSPTMLPPPGLQHPSGDAAGSGLPSRLAAHVRSPLVAGAVALMASTAATAGCGFVFWVIAARSYSPTLVGQATGIIAACLALTLVAGQVVAVTVLGRLPRASDRHGMLAVALASTGIVATL